MGSVVGGITGGKSMTKWPEEMDGREHLIALEKWLDGIDKERHKTYVGDMEGWFEAYVQARLNLFQIENQWATKQKGQGTPPATPGRIVQARPVPGGRIKA